MTQRIVKANFVQQNPEHVGGVILSVEIVVLESTKTTTQFSANGGVLFGARANLLSGHRRGSATIRNLKSWTLGKEQESRLAVKSHHGSYNLMHDGDDSNSSGYRISIEERSKKIDAMVLIDTEGKCLLDRQSNSAGPMETNQWSPTNTDTAKSNVRYCVSWKYG